MTQVSGKPDIRNKIFSAVLTCCLFCGVTAFFGFLYLINDLPDINSLESKGRRASIVFESYDGKVIATYGDLFRNVVNVNDLPKHVSNTFIAIEDRRFYSHCGVDFVGIFRAMYANLVAGKIVQGGSTLTQQLAKNLFLSQNKSFKRKIQEFILALWLERKFSKEQILSIYLNRMYFGAGAYGIDAAAYRYFGKNAKTLTLYEACKLAGILKSPTMYSPFYNSAKSDERTDLVLSCMVESGYISEDMRKEALETKDLHNKEQAPMDEYRYFTDWALEQLQDLVATDSDDLIVRTTLDYNLQKNATYIIRNTLNEYGFKNSASQMALVAIDKTGAVRAMIGGHTYSTSQFNRVLAQRSSGSAFKYFVYLSAFEKGMNINDEISDLPITIGRWTPKNCGHTNVGNISLRDAFAYSVNTASVRLATKIGIRYIIKRAEEIGISGDMNPNYATALGACGSNLLEMTQSYGVVMTDGVKLNPFSIVTVRNQKNRILYQAQRNQSKQVISHENCLKMKDLLKAVINYGTAKRAKLPVDAFGKSGTSNDNRDASFIGFVYPIVVGVWCGNDDNTPMKKSVTGGFIPAIAWKEFMLYAFGYKNIEQETSCNNVNVTKTYHKKCSIKELF